MNILQLPSQPPHPSLHLSHLSTFHFPKPLQIGIQPPTLNKIQPSDTSFFCGYSNGMVLEYSYNSLHSEIEQPQVYIGKSTQKLYNPASNPQYKEVYYPYQNCDVIDVDVFSKDVLLTCTHTEVTLLNTNKNKRISLRVRIDCYRFQGHQQTPIAVSCHPVSPLVVSVSNLIIQHDIRIQKPILVNYITPPAYDIEFFPDGQFYLLSGEPIRIGKDKWMRTLENGISTMSRNSKFILSNDMNSRLTLWDWRKSQKLRVVEQVKNEQQYQQVHFLSKDGVNSQIVFLEEDGNILHHDIVNDITKRHRVVQPEMNDNWKCQVSTEGDNTKHLIVYEHTKTEIKCFGITNDGN